MSRSSRGFTLIEILIAITLVGLLSTGMLMAIRIALGSQERADARLIANRRVVGAQRAIEQQLASFIPATASWIGPNGAVEHAPFFGGDNENLHLVSSYSLNGANRGLPQILDFRVIPNDQDEGVRLIVNESPYRGTFSADGRIEGLEKSESGQLFPLFFPGQPGPASFVLADRLRYCRFIYEALVRQPEPHAEWTDVWASRAWPIAVRVEMTPLDAGPARLHPTTVTAELHANRFFDREYHDFDAN